MITLLSALSEMYQHQDKKQYFCITLTAKEDIESSDGVHKFRETNIYSKTYIEKSWDKIKKSWKYVIKEPYVPGFGYGEDLLMSKVAAIKCIQPYFNEIRYVVEIESGDVKKGR
jgi:hypothetical protein